MIKKIKKTLSLFMALAMLFSLTTLTQINASASENDYEILENGMLYNKATNHYYEIGSSRTSYTEAKADATSKGGYIVCVSDKEENDQIQQFVIKQLYEADFIYIGLVDEGDNNSWAWEDSSEVSFTHWEAGEPNGLTETNTELALFQGGCWNDIAPNNYLYYVIEYNSCPHPDTVIKNRTYDCINGGYTGDVYCNICGEMVEEGETIEGTGSHNFELTNDKEPTCYEEGYTGDNVCSDCGYVEAKGTTIPKLNHEFNNGYCEVCGTYKVSKYHEQAIMDYEINKDNIFSFTATENGKKTFYATNNELEFNLSAYLYTSVDDLIKDKNAYEEEMSTTSIKNYLATDDDSGVKGLPAITYDLKKGTTYYVLYALQVSMSLEANNSSEDSDYCVTAQVSCTDFIPEIKTLQATQPTCDFDGKTASIYCEYCKNKIGGETITRESTSHIYEDGYCTACGLPENFLNFSDGYYLINSVDDFITFTSFLNKQNYNSNINVKLTSNIDLSNYIKENGWSKSNLNNCIFDGNGYAITGINFTTDYDCELFDSMSNCTFKNVSLNGNIIRPIPDENASLIASNASYCTFENIDVKGSSVITDQCSSLYVTQTDNCIFTNCDVDNCKLNSYFASMFTDQSYSNEYKNCTVKNSEITGRYACGFTYSASFYTTFYNCSIASSKLVGSHVFGFCSNFSGYSKMENCVNSSTIESNSYGAGFTYAVYKSEINSCLNEGNITSPNAASGFTNNLSSGTINSCKNTGTITSPFSAACGFANSTFETSYILNCLNQGNISGAYYASGISNYTNYGVCSITNCFNTGKISSDKLTGDLVIYEQGFNIKNSGKSHIHTYKRTTITKRATTTADGSCICKCSTCGLEYNETFARISSIKLSATSYVYNGTVKTPKFIVLDSNKKVIPSSNYTVSYDSGRKNVGRYSVTISFKNLYSGTYIKSFTIKPTSTKLSVSKGYKKFKATWIKKTTQVTGYQLQYSIRKDFGNARTRVISNNKTSSKVISNLSKNKTYYVRIRTYKKVTVNKKTTTYYSTWSSVKEVSTKSK